jgi:hypothetical protein
MKIDYVKPSEASVDMGEKFFSISDEAFIFEILRNKMYSNPILAVVREYACNALDAMVELGMAATPIEITMPTYNDLYFKVKDSGVGISPDRIENIYIKYAESTKRNDNNQIGGFGLGSKAGFAYSDSFTIITNFEGVKYNYACFIDETKLGKMAMLSKEPTAEANGTTIIVPVKSYSDITYFRSAVEYVCRHWETKPIVHGDQIEYKKLDKIIGGNTWFITNNSSYYDKGAKIILGNIEYAIKSSEFKDSTEISRIINKYRHYIVLKLNIGDLTLAANRESIHVDDKNRAVIQSALQLAESEIDKHFSDTILGISNLYDAFVFYQNIASTTYADNTDLISKWKNKDLSNSRFNVAHFLFYRNSSNNKITRQQNSCIRFDSSFDKVKFYVNDTNVIDLTGRHISKIFTEESDVKELVIFKNVQKCDFDKFIKENDIEDFEVEKLSSVLNNIKNYNFAGNKFIISKLHGCKFLMSSIDEVKSDKNKIVLCHLTKNFQNDKVPVSINKAIGKGLLPKLSKANTNISFYGIDQNANSKKIEKVFPNFIWLDDFINSQVTSSKEEYFESKYAIDFAAKMSNFIFNKIEFYKSGVLKTSGDFYNYINYIENIYSCHNGNYSKVSLYEEVHGNSNHQDFHNWKELNEKLDHDKFYNNLSEIYPVLKLVQNNFSLNYVHNYEQIIIDYINLVDSK